MKWRLPDSEAPALKDLLEARCRTEMAALLPASKVRGFDTAREREIGLMSIDMLLDRYNAEVKRAS